jgi:LPS O-antigen subunit length determinant protein (WzzB/FepE family)
MAYGQFEGKDIRHPDIRRMFTRDQVLASDWYKNRLVAKQKVDIALWTRHVDYLKTYIDQTRGETGLESLRLSARLQTAQEQLAVVSRPGYLQTLVGTIGVDPCLYGPT